MMKTKKTNSLTKIQVIAFNIVNTLLNEKAKETYDPETLKILFCFNEEFKEYKETKNKDCLKIAKNYVYELAEIFSKAKEEWGKDDDK